MALQLATLDPTATSPAPSAYWRIVETNFNFADSIGRIVVHAYRDQAAREAGRQPLQAFQFQITPAGRAAVTDPVTGAVISPAEPGFNDLVSQLATAYDAIKAAFYDLIKAQPQFAGAVDV